jgi:tRNA threonylcarbamoyladenosine biosynthesis protein TsaE
MGSAADSPTIVTQSAAETEALARSVGGQIAPGTLLLLYGDLGAGKTAFVRGLAAGLDVDPEDVSSPTFTIVQEYHGRVRLQHVDLYRVERADEIEDLNLQEFIARGDVVAVEWAERMSWIPDAAVRVTITDLGGDQRRITVSSRTRGE